MKILMISEKDAANASLAKISEAYIKRGHEIVIYAAFISDNVLRFFDKSISIYPLSKLDADAINECDIIFVTTMAVVHMNANMVLRARKPIIAHTYLINKQVQWGGDVCFVASLPTSTSEYDDYVRYPRIEIGEPKYDNVKVSAEESKRLLLIDSGHYPFGMRGKKELAKTIISICRDYPAYELCIKPRFLPEDSVVTHKNAVHIYDIIRDEAGNDLPPNLVLLSKHEDLMELIESSCTVICMHTTAFPGAYVAGKGLIVLDNLPSEDIYDVRWKISARIRDYMAGSGALTEYTDVKKVLPRGVKCSEEYLRYLLAETENVADKICEVSEFLHDTYYSKKIFPQYEDCSYRELKEKKYLCSNTTWDEVIKERYVNYVIVRMLAFIDFHIKAKLNIQVLERYIKEFKQNAVITDKIFREFMEKITVYRDECIVDNEAIMLEDEVDSGILLNSFYQLKRYDKIINFPQKKLGAYHLFRGFVAFEQKELDVARKELVQYIDESVCREYIKEISDMSNNKMKAFYILISLLLEEGAKNSAEYYMEKMQEFYYSLYPDRGREILSRLQGQHYTCMYTLKARVYNNKLAMNLREDERIMIYGVGIITKKMLLKNVEVANRTAVLIDKKMKSSKYEGITVVRPEDITQFMDVNTVIVTVPQEYLAIKEMLSNIRKDLRVFSVTEIYED